MAGFMEVSLIDLSNLSNAMPFDAVIVGAGTSGLTVAATLVQTGLRVALIEAGPAPFLTHIQNTDLRFAPQLSRNLRDRLRYRPQLANGGFFGTNFGCFGGRGLFWNGAAPRFSAVDFANWPLQGVPDEAAFKWAEEQFRVTVAFGQTVLARRLIGQLSAGGFAAEPGPFAVEVGDVASARLGAGIASGLGLFFRLAGDAAVAGNVKVAIGSMVDRLLIDGAAVRGVLASRDGADPVEILGRSVVICAGGIESIKLAAVSGVPDPAARIGKGIQEHLFYHAVVDAPHLYDTARPDIAIIYVRSPGTDGHQWELHAPGNRMFALDDGTPWQPVASPPYQIMIRSFAATEKRDENFIEAIPGILGSSRVHFSHSPKDEERKQLMAADAVRIGNALGASIPDGKSLGSIERIRAPGSSYHEAGGLDMGLDPDTSVTDPHGAFHSVPNLVCADAAAFPRIGATNPHLTLLASARSKALALAKKLASA